MNGYELSRAFIDFAFENPDKIKPNHYAVYFFAIEHCNRLGWKEKFGLPSTMTMEAVGIKSHNTYMKTFNDLEDWGLIKVVERSKNQYSANIIALSKFDKALDKALDKAFIKHSTKQSESTVQSIDSIDKPLTINQETINKEPQVAFPFESETFSTSWNLWKNYKEKEHKFKYKTPTSEQAALLKLSKLSGGQEKKAIEIINESLANGWQGFFEIKETKNGKSRLSEEQQQYLAARTDI
jgi:hypothetical protein